MCIKRKDYYNEITILKVIATLFITWFHFKWSVPQFWSSLFIGGAIGNSLFFFCSGYLLKLKEENFKGEWLLNKLLRILPSIWIFCGITYLLKLETFSWYNFIFPTTYWFVNTILYFFVLFYIFNRFIEKHKWLTLIIATTIYILLYILYIPHNELVLDAGGEQCFYFFLFLLYGYYLKQGKSKIIISKWSAIESFISLALFYTYKILCNKFPELIIFQFVVIPLLLWYLIYSFYKLTLLLSFIKVKASVKYFITLLSNLTLDVYIVQMVFIDNLMPKITFPINVCVIFILILFAAYINYFLAEKTTHLLKKIFHL